MAATIGVASALARTATPPPSAWRRPDIELALGYDLDGPPTVSPLLTDWRFDWLLGTASIVAAVLYLVGVRRLRRNGAAAGRRAARSPGWSAARWCCSRRRPAWAVTQRRNSRCT